jgi:hypothetical protein
VRGVTGVLAFALPKTLILAPSVTVVRVLIWPQESHQLVWLQSALALFRRNEPLDDFWPVQISHLFPKGELYAQCGVSDTDDIRADELT